MKKRKVTYSRLVRFLNLASKIYIIAEKKNVTFRKVEEISLFFLSKEVKMKRGGSFIKTKSKMSTSLFLALE